MGYVQQLEVLEICTLWLALEPTSVVGDTSLVNGRRSSSTPLVTNMSMITSKT